MSSFPSSRNSNIQSLHLGSPTLGGTHTTSAAAAAGMMMNQFPAQRLPVSFANPGLAFPSASTSDPYGNILGMSMSSSGVKRLSDPLESSSSKRWKEMTTTTMTPPLAGMATAMMDTTTTTMNPMLTGGFRTPRWDGFMGLGGGLQQPIQHYLPSTGISSTKSALISRLRPKHGAFPMPGLSEASIASKQRYSLDRFEELWNSTDEDIRMEVLARRLERTDHPIPPRNYRKRRSYGA